VIVADVGIFELVEQGYLPHGLTVGPSSVDLTLSNSFSVQKPKGHEIVLGEKVEYEATESDTFRLEPNDFVLASTCETIRIPNNMAAYVEGRSSIGRLGLQVQNAGFIDAGFYGEITLELENQSRYPIILRKGIRICQIVFVLMSAEAQTPYCGKYNGQTGATASRLDQDIELHKK